MNKKEILDKAQIESEDEGLKNAENTGRRWGVLAINVLLCVFIVYAYIKNIDSSSYFAILMAYDAAEILPKYIFTKQGKYLVFFVIFAVTAVINLVVYFTK